MSEIDEATLRILEKTLDSKALAAVRMAIADAERLKVIRDAFLTGRDVEAVELIRTLDLTKALDDAKKKISSAGPATLGVRRAFLGISSRFIPAGASERVVVRPQIPFKADRFAVSRRCSEHFLISSIRVGNRAQDAAPSEIAADLMEGAFDVPDLVFDNSDPSMPIEVRIDSLVQSQIGIAIDMDTCQTAMDLVLDVVNESSAQQRFFGLYLGVVPNDY